MKNCLIILILFGVLGAGFAFPCYGEIDGRNPGFVIGYGMSFVGTDDYRTNDIYGSGVLFKGEYGLFFSRNLETRFYAGGVFTSAKKNTGGGVYSDANVSSSLGFVGAKIHVAIPIPQIAPFIEVGIGGSIGSLTTNISDLYNEENSGAILHIPFSLGLAFGERRQIEVTFSYLFYPSYDHIDGGVALGVHFGEFTGGSSSDSTKDFGLF